MRRSLIVVETCAMAEPNQPTSLTPQSPAPAAGASPTPPEASPEAVKAALDALSQAKAANAPTGETDRNGAPQPVNMPAFGATTGERLPEGIDLLSDVNLNVRIELGRTKMLLEDVLRLGEGSVVELDKLAGDPVDVYVNDRPVARGEVLVLNDNFCVRINEIISTAGADAA